VGAGVGDHNLLLEEAMSEYGWIKEITAAAAIILFCYFLLRAIISRADTLTKAVLDRSREDSATIKEMADDISGTLVEIEQSMSGRDQIIINHMEHFETAMERMEESQERIASILDRVCDEFDINGDYRRKP